MVEAREIAIAGRDAFPEGAFKAFCIAAIEAIERKGRAVIRERHVGGRKVPDGSAARVPDRRAQAPRGRLRIEKADNRERAKEHGDSSIMRTGESWKETWGLAA